MTHFIAEKPLPFDLPIEDEVLHCQKLLQAIPKNQLTLAGIWQQKPVLAKIFVNPFGGWFQFNRELQGTQALLAASIPTPVIVYAGYLKKFSAFIILFEQLNDANELNVCFQASNLSLERLALLRQLVEIIARQHEAGIIHINLQLKNFLLTNNVVYSMDTGNIRLRKKPLSVKKSLNLFASLLTQIDLIENKLKKEAITWYFQLRNWPFEPHLLSYLDKQENYWQKKREKTFRSTLFRSSTHFATEKTPQRFWVCDRHYLTDELLALLKAPEYLFSTQHTKIIKNDATTTVGVIQISQHWLLVKRYNLKHFWHRLKRLITKTRAKKSWENAHRLLFRGISTPRPVAMIEDRRGIFQGTCYFISEYVPSVTASDYFKPHQIDPTQGYRVARKILNILHLLTKKKVYHGDLKSSNILINQQGIWLIDLDATRFYQNHFYFNSRARKDRERFMKNWRGQPIIKRLFH